MNAAIHTRNQPRPVVLGRLLHSISQPLTTLHCALEVSLVRDHRGDTSDVALALEQTQRLIESFRLVREYLEVEQGLPPGPEIQVRPILQDVVNELSKRARSNSLRLEALGALRAVLRVHREWIHRAFTYLIEPVLEGADRNARVRLVLDESGSRSRLRLVVSSAAGQKLRRAFTPEQQVKIAIAQLALESAGARLEVHKNKISGFTVLFPASAHAGRPGAAHRAES